MSFVYDVFFISTYIVNKYYTILKAISQGLPMRSSGLVHRKTGGIKHQQITIEVMSLFDSWNAINIYYDILLIDINFLE